jgi:hypothetical protein
MTENRYIAVEGVIGVGKTSLSKLLTERLQAQLVLEEVEGEPKTTPRAGLLCVAEQMRAMGLPATVEEELGCKKGGSGFSDWEVVESFLLMLADGGECVEDLGVLRGDRALVKLLGHEVASAPVGKKFLYTFHDDERAFDAGGAHILQPAVVDRECGLLHLRSPAWRSPGPAHRTRSEPRGPAPRAPRLPAAPGAHRPGGSRAD